jgi:vacuolar-type H+-ATPase subunit D/Vma8
MIDLRRLSDASRDELLDLVVRAWKEKHEADCNFALAVVNLTAVQTRCTELLGELRATKRRVLENVR